VNHEIDDHGNRRSVGESVVYYRVFDTPENDVAFALIRRTKNDVVD